MIIEIIAFDVLSGATLAYSTKFLLAFLIENTIYLIFVNLAY